MGSLKSSVLVLCLALCCVLGSGDGRSYASEESHTLIKLWFGGDVHLGDMGLDPFIALSKVTADHIGIINLEGPVHEPANTQYKDKRIMLFNAPDSIRYLKTLNVRIAGVANNHQGDAGTNGKNDTEQVLKDYGIEPVGGSQSAITLPVHGLRLTFMAFDLSDGIPAHLGDTINKNSKRGDMTFVTLHVSGPPLYLPDKRLKEATNIALESGADAVVSHGTHTVGPVERRGNKVIAWGLGNLVFDCKCTKEDEGVILELSIDPANKEHPAVSACVVPVGVGLGGQPSAPAASSEPMFDLLTAIGSDGLIRQGNKACF